MQHFRSFLIRLTFWVSLLCAVENRGILPFVLGILIAVVRKPGKVRACEEKRCVVANVKVVVCGGAGSWHLTD